MNLFQQQSFRRPRISIMLSLLLVIATGISSIAFTTWLGANEQFARLDQNYITVAFPNNTGLDSTVTGAARIRQDSFILSDGTIYVGPRDAEETAKTSQHYIQADQRILLSAHVEGMTALTSGRVNPFDYQIDYDSFCYSGCVAILECVQASTDDAWLPTICNTVTFRIVDWVSRSDAYDFPEENEQIYMETFLANADGSPFFEEGKTYLVNGFYKDYDIYRSYDDSKAMRVESDSHGRRILIDLGTPELSIRHPKVWFNQYIDQETGFFLYYHMSPNSWPVAVEFDGDLETFLTSAEGRVWKEEIIPSTQTGHNSAPVILTDKLESMYNFVLGDAAMVDGRMFTQEEYDQGKKVCVVSAAYAELNDLKLGDTISLDFYNSGYQGCDIDGIVTIQRLSMVEESHLGIKQDYTIVGTYRCPGWGGSAFDFGEDTIFVPKASVPGWESLATGKLLPVLNSVVIENGAIDEFEAHMAADGKAGVYFYLDQGYTELEESLKVVQMNATWILLIGLLVFLPAALVFVHLELKQHRAVARSLRLLGVKSQKVWLQSMGTTLTTSMLAVLLGNALGATFFRLVTKQLLAVELTLGVRQIFLSFGVQLLVITALAAVWTAGTVGRKLMCRK